MAIRAPSTKVPTSIWVGVTEELLQQVVRQHHCKRLHSLLTTALFTIDFNCQIFHILKPKATIRDFQIDPI